MFSSRVCLRVDCPLSSVLFAMSQRPRCDLHKRNDLRETLKTHIVSPISVQYTEKMTGKIDTKALSANAGLLRALRALQPNLAFPPVLMSQALVDLAKAKKKDWKFTAQDIEDFGTTVSKQIRAMCRHYSQALCKRTKPKWLKQLAGDAKKKKKPAEEDEEAEEEEEQEEEEKKAEEEDDDDEEPPASEVQDSKETQAFYNVGWDAEQKLAWRSRAGHGKDRAEHGKEYTNELLEPAAGSDSGNVRARWADGYVAELDVSNSQWVAQLAAQLGKRKNPRWEKNDVQVRIKSDRIPLVWVKEGAKQLCQLGVHRCLSENAAVALMIVVAGEYVSKKLRAEDMYRRRDELLREHLIKFGHEIQAAPKQPRTKVRKVRREDSVFEGANMDLPPEQLMGMDEWAAVLERTSASSASGRG